jgi:hypothetical protein
MHRSTADVSTSAAVRYAKQLLAHLGRNAIVQPLEGEPDGGRLVFAYGVGVVCPAGDTLILHAEADDLDGLAHVEDVLGRHLERFGVRRELSVSWTRASND